MKVLVTEYVCSAYYGGCDIKTYVDIPDNTKESIKNAVVKAIFKTDESDNYEINLYEDEKIDGVYHITSVELKCKALTGRFIGRVRLDVRGKVELI